MPFSLDPGFIILDYHSAYAPHVQLLPIKGIQIDTADPHASEIDTWDGGAISWVTMTDAMVALFADRYPATVHYDRATLWSKPTEEDLPLFIDAYNMDVVGTVGTPGYTKAVQETIMARDTGGNIVKLVFLDMASTNNFDKQLTLAAAGITDLFAEWTAETNGWASRAGLRPSVFSQATRNINEKLRREYKAA